MKRFVFLLITLCLLVPSLEFGTAETLTATRAVAGFPVAGVGLGGSVKAAYGSYLITATVEDGDKFELCKIPRGATVVGGVFYASDIDATTGTAALDIDIGWATSGSLGNSPAGFLNAGTLSGDAVTGYKPETGTILPFGGILLVHGSYKFNQETKIQAEVNTAPATFATGTIGVVVYYMMD